MRELLRVVFRHVGAFTVELALLASADTPVVAAAMQRVSRRRVSYLRALFVELGFAQPEADRHALLAYTTYLGHAQLARTCPELVPAGHDERDDYLDSVLAALTRA